VLAQLGFDLLGSVGRFRHGKLRDYREVIFYIMVVCSSNAKAGGIADFNQQSEICS
jgi:hypothetical protein